MSSSLSSPDTKPESTQETKAEVVFTPEEEAIYTLADKLNLSLLKRDTNHKEHCSKLFAKGVTTQEQMESLMAFSQRKLSSKGAIDLCLGNLVREVNGWLQLQTKPKASCTVGEMHLRPFRDQAAVSLAKQDEVKAKVLQQEAEQGGRRLTLEERKAAYLAKKKAEAQQNSAIQH